MQISLSISPFHLLCLTTRVLPLYHHSFTPLHISNAWRLAFQMCKDLSTTLCLAILSVNAFRLSVNPYCTPCKDVSTTLCLAILSVSGFVFQLILIVHHVRVWQPSFAQCSLRRARSGPVCQTQRDRCPYMSCASAPISPSRFKSVGNCLLYTRTPL